MKGIKLRFGIGGTLLGLLTLGFIFKAIENHQDNQLRIEEIKAGKETDKKKKKKQ